MEFLREHFNEKTDTNDPEMKSSFQRGYYLQHIQEVPNWAVTGLSETAREQLKKKRQCPVDATYNIYLELDSGLYSYHENVPEKCDEWFNNLIDNPETVLKTKHRRALKILYMALSHWNKTKPEGNRKVNFVIFGRKKYDDPNLDFLDYVSWKSDKTSNDITNEKMRVARDMGLDPHFDYPGQNENED